jgi:hypothetical protein
MRNWLANVLVLIIVCSAVVNLANAQITRDVGEIAVIEGDPAIIFTPTNSTTGNPCGQASVNMRALARRFYQTHDDAFQFLIMFTNFNHLLAPDANCIEQAGAFHQLVSNSTQGINQPVFNNSNSYGSSGVLGGVLNMNNLTTWPFNPTVQVPGFGTNSLLSILGQEVGHQWGAFVRFDDDPSNSVNRNSDLLGRASAHWSFFFHASSATSNATNSEASSLEGNFWQINQPTQGQFQTSTVTDGFSPLDLYLMGLLPADQVEQFWYIANPNNVNPPANAANAPRAGTRAQGNQTFVNIQNVIGAEGARNPDFENSPKIFRQAFILLTQQGVNATQAHLRQIDTCRVLWEKYFAEKTQNRGAVVTNLSNVIFVDRDNSKKEDGTLNHPFNTIREGLDNSASDGTVVITANDYHELMTLNRPMKLRAVLGTVTIGNPGEPIIIAKEGNNCSQDDKGSTLYEKERCYNFKKGDNDFENDEARSLVIQWLPRDAIIEVYDDPNGKTNDDWTSIKIKKAVPEYCIGSFENSYEDDIVIVEHHHKNGLNGKVSHLCMR